MKALKNIVMNFKNALLQALPVILFFLFLFYTIIVFFGVQYVMLVSFITVLFKVNYQKKHTMRKLLFMVMLQFSLCFLSFLATRNIVLCVMLNICVPFLLVFFQTTQFQQKGYFTSAMGFVFLQLRPVGWNTLLPLMGAMAYALTITCIALLMYSYINKKHAKYQMARKGIHILAQQLDALTQGVYEENKGKELFTLQQNMQKVTYQSRGVSYLMDKEGKIYYMFALLFQRSMYFLNTHAHKRNDFTHTQIKNLQEVSKFLYKSENFALTDTTSFIEEGQQLLAKIKEQEDMPSLYIRNFMNLYLMILHDIRLSQDLKPHKDWKVPAHEKIIPSIKRRFRFESFEFRFAFRLSMVLVIGFVFTYCSGLNHAYWLPLNAFLLLQPMYEDSTTRLKNRFIGTCSSCLCIYFLLPYFSGTSGHFLFASLMVTCMYCVVPGTWPQALFSTSFALTLASMAMNETMAIELRFLYVCCAICLVLIVNRFFFPTSLQGLFHDNVRRMFHVQHAYLQMVYYSLKKPLDYGVISDALTKFHMLYDQISNYLKHPNESLDTEYFTHLLAIFWSMVSEMEQILFFINNDTFDESEIIILYDYINVCDYVLYHIQSMLRIQKESEELEINNRKLILQIENKPHLSVFLHEYAKNISSLYAMALIYVKNDKH